MIRHNKSLGQAKVARVVEEMVVAGMGLAETAAAAATVEEAALEAAQEEAVALPELAAAPEVATAIAMAASTTDAMAKVKGWLGRRGQRRGARRPSRHAIMASTTISRHPSTGKRAWYAFAPTSKAPSSGRGVVCLSYWPMVGQSLPVCLA